MTLPIHVATARALSTNGAARALPGVRAELSRLNEQLATGLRIHRASDDPTAFAQARSLRFVEDRLAQHERSIGAARTWVDQTGAALDGIHELFVQAQEIGLRGANGVLDREDFARQIESLRDELTTRLNSRSGTEYLFAGNETGTAPLHADGTLAAGDFSGTRTREVAPGVTLAVNVPGTEALSVGGTPATALLTALADAIRSGDPAATTAALSGVEAGRDHYSRLAASNGDTSRRLLAAADSVAQHAFATADRRSTLEDADLATVIGELQRRQTGLEAALRATAASTQPSLLDYLR